jgi:septum site-determining protein MinD
MVKSGEMLSINDLLEHLCIDLLGVVPEDKGVIVSTNRGEPIILNESSPAAQAFNNIVQRLLGQEVSIMTFEDISFWGKVRSLFARNK